jgi:isopenicillin-N epimerase
MKDLFLLDPKITYLNFGSFGACPKPIFDDYIQWQYLLEKDPVQFITETGPEYLALSKNALAAYINCESKDLILTPNPTYAINLLVKNLKLNPGDEVLTTNLEYGALDKTWNFYLNKYGGKYVQSSISLPIQSKEEFIAEFWTGYSDKTKVVFISQITSATGLILPVKEICVEAKKRGLITIVDGAHVPGHIHLNLKELDSDFYTGACHKWMMTPKGCSFLFAKKEFHQILDPLIVSWGYNNDTELNRLHEFHQFNGTRDFSAYLTIPAALKFMNDYNWPKQADDCKDLLLSSAKRVLKVLNTKSLAPLNKDFFGQLCSCPIISKDPVKLKKLLFDKYQIQIPIIESNSNVYLRFSIQAFNDDKDIDNLIYALEDIGTANF